MSEFENATPRPWHPYYAGPQDTHILAGGGPIAKLLPVKGDQSQSQQEANAELIVRAVNAFEPLTEALAEVMGWISNWDPNFIYDDEWSETRQKAEAALAKARGEQ